MNKKNKKDDKITNTNKNKAVEDTSAILSNIIQNEVEKTEALLRKKHKEAQETLHNKIIVDIQEVGLPPADVVFILDMLKSEILNQVLNTIYKKQKGGNT